LWRTAIIRCSKGALEKGGQVKGILAQGWRYSRKEIDDLIALSRTFGAKGLLTIQVTDQGIKSPSAKFLKDEEMQGIVATMARRSGI